MFVHNASMHKTASFVDVRVQSIADRVLIVFPIEQYISTSECIN